MNEPISFNVSNEEVGMRLDHFLVRKLPEFTRSRIQNLIKQGFVTVNDQIADPARKLKPDQQVKIILPPLQEAQPKGQSVPFDIIYEDEDLIVVNKPAGLVVHPGAGNPDLTLVNGLIAYCGDTLSGIGGVKRPGIVHRLDKNTSGLMVVAKNDFTHQGLSAQFAKRTLKRSYLAFCWGLFHPLSGTIEGNIGRDPRHRQRMKILSHGGKEAITDYRVIENYNTYASCVECHLRTGRTHQIRVHLSSIQHGIIGDSIYGKPSRGTPTNLKEKLADLTQNNTRSCLHAYAIQFIHPRTLQKLKFQVPLPNDLTRVKEYLLTL
jgi:23S rRNA pseudouridine1911/1915/1917 synthase